jgi:glyoxylase-like metal-dependent hydrolase (beta-lactamase superfamily II)
MAALKGLGANPKVHTVFNTHYHAAQTGNNDAFAAAGAKIVAHDRTRQWLSVDHWLPDQDRYQKARPKAAWPTDVFFNTGSRKIGGEQIDYGYLLVAHTAGDIYVYFKDSNVLAVGDVASPVNDPELDWITGAWIGGRVSAMNLLLKIGNDRTRVVPGSGPVMTWAEFKAERDLMEVVRQRLFKANSAGRRPPGHGGRWRLERSCPHLEGSRTFSLCAKGVGEPQQAGPGCGVNDGPARLLLGVRSDRTNSEGLTCRRHG